MNRANVLKTSPYIILGFILWLAVLESGIHATIAGVISAMFVPFICKKDPCYSPGKNLEHALNPWIAFGVLPLFAFANAGVSLAGFTFGDFLDPVTLGIILGLVVGKQLGVFSMLFFAIKAGIASMPEDIGWRHIYAVSVLGGIGFSMSLFIGGLAFTELEMQASVRVGVLTGSVISALLAYSILFFNPVDTRKLQQETKTSP
jgi:NhaA family Na+:H+ antiporter